MKQELKNHQSWVSTYLKGCRFKGRLSGCDFGYWPEYGSDPWYQHGFIEDCDFTDARLDGCRFHGCDPATLRFPKWPHFTILDPIGNAQALCSVKWPERFGAVVMEDLHAQPSRTQALTENALILAKQFETTPEDLKAVLEQFDCVIC